MKHQKSASIALVLCLLAAIFYNSWPLGYALDSQTAHSAMASDLERVGRPYYWLFILGDVLTCLSVFGAVAILRFRLWPKLRSKTVVFICVGLFLFGVFTAISALLPSACTITLLLRCGADDGKGLGLDAITSSIAAAGLFISLIGASVFGTRHKLSMVLTRATQAILAVWSASGLLFVILALGNGNAHLMQYVFLIFCGFGILAVGMNVYSVIVRQPDHDQHHPSDQIKNNHTLPKVSRIIT